MKSRTFSAALISIAFLIIFSACQNNLQETVWSSEQTDSCGLHSKAVLHFLPENTVHLIIEDSSGNHNKVKQKILPYTVEDEVIEFKLPGSKLIMKAVMNRNELTVLVHDYSFKPGKINNYKFQRQ